MARPLRIEYPGAFYHILSRGNHREVIFHTDEDRETFLARLRETITKYRLKLHAFVLMDNHYHFLVETMAGNLSKAMHYFHASYSNWLKVRHQIVGSIFQGRYRSILVEKEPYLIDLCVYIHLNPVRAKMIDDPMKYRWSSHRCYCKKAHDLDFVYTQELLGLIGGYSAYQDYVRSRLEEDWVQEDVYGRNTILGGEFFRKEAIARVRKENRGAHAQREITDLRKLQLLNADDIRRILIVEMKIAESALSSKRNGNLYRQLYAYGLKNYTSLRLREIGQHLNMDYSAVSIMVKRFIMKAEKEGAAKALIDQFTEIIYNLPKMSNVET